MEEKKPVNVRLSTAILIIIIIALIGGLVFLAYQNAVLKNKQDESKTEIQELQSKRTQELQDLQNKTQELQKTIDDAKNTLSNSTANNAQTNTAKESNTTKKEDKYKEITKPLDGEDGLFVTDVEVKNNEYILKGVVYKGIKNAHPDWQISTAWKLTDEYRKVTVDGNLSILVDDFEDEKEKVSEFFKNWKEQKAEKDEHPSPLFNFKFKNGKCIDIYTLLTGV